MNIESATGKVLFCEPDARIIQAAHTLADEGSITPILVGDEEAYRSAAPNQALLEDIQIVPIDAAKYAQKYYELREHKGISQEDALKACEDPATYSCMLMLDEEADALICGATWPTSRTLKPALSLFSEGLASSYFIMDTQRGELLFADCALNIQPDAQQLAQIAINTGYAAQRRGMQPHIAMLSFSTNNSADHEDQQKVAQATQILKKHVQSEKLAWEISGEIQVDAALNEEVAQQKAPGQALQGDANVLIFPDLDAGNIGYKLVQQFTGCEAIGPIITGLTHEVNDLSRGCSAEEIVKLTRISVWNATQ